MKVTVSVHTGRFLQIKHFEKYDLFMFHAAYILALAYM